jgi:DNA-binding LytR/AlgR family response regulator
MRMILTMQASSEELLRVRIDTILEERGRGAAGHLKEQLKPSTIDHQLQLPTDPGAGPIYLSQIEHVTVEDHYLRIHYHVNSQRKNTLIRMPLKELSARLPEDQFARIHRSHIINLAWVDGVKRVGREVQLTMKHGDFRLPVSRYRLPQLLPVLEKFLNPGTS